jgi:Zn-dependent protease
VQIDTTTIVLIAIFLLVAFPVHEFSHAFVAYRLGDSTAKMFGRLTLNPIVHFDPIGGLFLIISALYGGLLFGWAKPTPVNPAMLRDRRNGEVYVALAGPASNLIMAAIAAIVIRIVVGLHIVLPGIVDNVLYLFVEFNLALAIFNMIPVPPLDGSTLLFRVLDPRTAWQVRPILAQYGFLILLAVILLGSRVIGGVIFNATNLLVGF